MKNIPQITDSEWKIMKLLWANEPISSSEILTKLSPEVAWCINTVISLLNRLVKKGAVKILTDRPVKRYQAIVQEKDCELVESRNFLDKLYGGSLNKMVARFIDEDELSDQEISELVDIINKKRR